MNKEGLIGTVTPFKPMCALISPLHDLFTKYKNNIDFKELKTAIYVFSNMSKILKV